jgi:2-polyprenyl-6-hydroxyphenyl methylase/3-demethylubiquinone-9 3-methyltransferase
MTGYYTRKLTAQRLRQVYEIASPRVCQYLKAESDFVLDRIRPGDRVLDLGCGYGRVMGRWAEKAGWVVGVDMAVDSLLMGVDILPDLASASFAAMDAGMLGFKADTFDLTACIQNGISAFKVDPAILLSEMIRVTRPGGRVLLSSYAADFWTERLSWFRSQARHGLIGKIDAAATGNGVIVCEDGFRATIAGPEDLTDLLARFQLNGRVVEVDGSSVFCEANIGSDTPATD